MTAVTRVMIMQLVAAIAQAQPSFEVASVKVAPPVTNGTVAMSCAGGPGTADPGRLTCSHAALAMLVATAYDIQFYQLKTPDWMLWGGNSGGYDVAAKIPQGTTKDQYKLMLQNLLAERFRLEVHHEMRDYSQYSLVAGKGASKLTRSPKGSGDATPVVEELVGGNLRLTAKHFTMRNLASYLTYQMASPVTENTGLDGQYDFILEFAPDPRWRRLLVSPSIADYTENARNLFSALQEQLGLKLETRKAPLDFLIVDHAEKTPSEN